MEKSSSEISGDIGESLIYLIKTDEKLRIEMQSKLRSEMYMLELQENISQLTNKKFNDINELHSALSSALDCSEKLANIIMIDENTIGYSLREKITSPIKCNFVLKLNKVETEDTQIMAKQISRLISEKSLLEKRVRELEEIIAPKFEKFASVFDQENYATKWYVISDDGKRAKRNNEDQNHLKIIPYKNPVPSTGKHQLSFRIVERFASQSPNTLWCGVGTSELFKEVPDGLKNFYSMGVGSGTLSRNGPLYGGGFAILKGEVLDIKIDCDNRVLIFESQGYRLHVVKIDNFSLNNNFFPYMVSGIENDEVEII